MRGNKKHEQTSGDCLLASTLDTACRQVDSRAQTAWLLKDMPRIHRLMLWIGAT